MLAAVTQCLCVLVSITIVDTIGQTPGTARDKPREKCEVLNKNCTARVGCGMALHNFLLGCDTVISGETRNCSAQCTRALIALFSTEDNIGKSLISCDCQGDSYCMATNQRVSICANTVLDAMQTLKDSTSVISCNLARWLCEADAHCQTAFTYYLNHCQGLYEGHECTKSCNDSLVILYRQSKAAKLRQCQCEDSECSMIQTNTRSLCFQNHLGYAIRNHLHAHSGTSACKQFTAITLLMIYVSLVVLYQMDN